MNYEKLDADFKRLNMHTFKVFIITAIVEILVCIGHCIVPTDNVAYAITLILLLLVGFLVFIIGGMYIFAYTFRKELVVKCKNGEYD